jgi:peptidoglycan/xylan/chitin deacetylase (PgdA/CDA1 family)
MTKLRYQIARPWMMVQRGLNILKGPPPATAFRILLFHDIPSDRRDAFARFLGELKSTRQIISPEEAEILLSGNQPDQPAGGWNRLPVLISFDDGFLSNLGAATECLAAHDIKALFFVCPELVDLEGDSQRQAIASNIFRGRVDWRQISDAGRLMTWSELNALRTLGHTVGAHGMGHRRFSELIGGELEQEITGAKTRIEEKLSQPVDWYAFAFGEFGSVSVEALACISEHYKYCRSGIRGINSAAVNRFALLADQIDMAAPASYRNLVLAGGLDARYRKHARALSVMAN